MVTELDQASYCYVLAHAFATCFPSRLAARSWKFPARPCFQIDPGVKPYHQWCRNQCESLQIRRWPSGPKTICFTGARRFREMPALPRHSGPLNQFSGSRNLPAVRYLLPVFSRTSRREVQARASQPICAPRRFCVTGANPPCRRPLWSISVSVESAHPTPAPER